MTVRPAAALSRFELPAPPAKDALQKAVRTSLRLIDAAPDRIACPVFAAIWRAALDTCDFSVHLSGPSGVGKTELAALAQQHYGADLNARNLPASWSSTGNSLETLAFYAKDSLLVVDDFAPSGSCIDVQRSHREADRLFRAQGNRSGRARLWSDGKLRPVRSPRGMILSTGEDVPLGQSLRARIMVLEVGPGDVRWERISECQQYAANGIFAEALAGFVHDISANRETALREFRRDIATFRAAATGDRSHRRTPDITANLSSGLKCFLTFALRIQAISQEEAQLLWTRGWNALEEATAAQAQHQAASEPAGRFLELLSAAMAAGRAHVASPLGGIPDQVKAAQADGPRDQIQALWGWQLDVRDRGFGTGQLDWKSRGERVGWLEGENLYLEPQAAFTVAQRMAKESGQTISLTLTTLTRRLKDRGLLTSTEPTRKTLTVRRTLENKRRNVVHLDQNVLFADHSDNELNAGSRPPLWQDVGFPAIGEATRNNI